MAKTARRISYEEFQKCLADILDKTWQEENVLEVEKDGVTFTIEITPNKASSALPPTLHPDEVRRILKETAGGFRTLDRAGFLVELREARGQNSPGRPE
jgi:hypothetical protein